MMKIHPKKLFSSVLAILVTAQVFAVSSLVSPVKAEGRTFEVKEVKSNGGKSPQAGFTIFNSSFNTDYDMDYNSASGYWEKNDYIFEYTDAPVGSKIRIDVSFDGGDTWTELGVSTATISSSNGGLQGLVYNLGCLNFRAVGVHPTTLAVTSGYSNSYETCFKDDAYPALKFPDVPDSTTPKAHVFATFIINLANAGIVGGFPDGYFRPEYAVTRGAMAKFIKNAYGFANDTSCGNFPDVPTSHTFYNEITTLKCKGVINGFPDGTFQPSGIVDRGAAMKFTMNGLRVKHGNPNYLKYTGSAQRFSDVPTTNTFYEFIMAATEPSVAIVGGFPDGTFKPTVTTSRGAMSKMVDNARNK